ncbi:MAG: hypothetical protein RSB38_08560, partial [Oscillospiraceae bacterium]
MTGKKHLRILSIYIVICALMVNIIPVFAVENVDKGEIIFLIKDAGTDSVSVSVKMPASCNNKEVGVYVFNPGKTEADLTDNNSGNQISCLQYWE